jgi:hypothetical protein
LTVFRFQNALAIFDENATDQLSTILLDHGAETLSSINALLIMAHHCFGLLSLRCGPLVVKSAAALHLHDVVGLVMSALGQ